MGACELGCDARSALLNHWGELVFGLSVESGSVEPVGCLVGLVVLCAVYGASLGSLCCTCVLLCAVYGASLGSLCCVSLRSLCCTCVLLCAVYGASLGPPASCCVVPRWARCVVFVGHWVALLAVGCAQVRDSDTS